MMGTSTEDMNDVVEDDSHSSPGGTDRPICGSGRDIHHRKPITRMGSTEDMNGSDCAICGSNDSRSTISYLHWGS